MADPQSSGGKVMPLAEAVRRLVRPGSCVHLGAVHAMPYAASFDVTAGAREVAVVLPLAAMRLVEKVPYVTARGERVRTVVTQRGVLEKDDRGELALTRLLPHPGKSARDAVEEFRGRCGWELRIVEPLLELEPPTAAGEEQDPEEDRAPHLKNSC